jgi:hypothetical protein
MLWLIRELSLESNDVARLKETCLLSNQKDVLPHALLEKFLFYIFFYYFLT